MQRLFLCRRRVSYSGMYEKFPLCQNKVKKKNIFAFCYSSLCVLVLSNIPSKAYIWKGWVPCYRSEWLNGSWRVSFTLRTVDTLLERISEKSRLTSTRAFVSPPSLRHNELTRYYLTGTICLQACDSINTGKKNIYDVSYVGVSPACVERCKVHLLYLTIHCTCPGFAPIYNAAPL